MNTILALSLSTLAILPHTCSSDKEVNSKVKIILINVILSLACFHNIFQGNIRVYLQCINQA